MENLVYILSWGSPVGLGLFFLLSTAGTGILFWGISHFVKRNNASNESNEWAPRRSN
ncbi:MAG: hypothetical protein ACI9B9_001979 [Halioglobus sp.]|jgi:hypothetical protein